MVLAIISAVITINLLSFGIAASISASECDYRYYYGYSCIDYYPSSCHYVRPCHDNPDWKVVVGMEACLAILGVIAGVLCIWGSALCCSAVCCCNSRSTTMYPASYPGQQTCVISQQQQQPQFGPIAPPPYSGQNISAGAPEGYPMQYNWTAPPVVAPTGEPLMPSSSIANPNQVSLASTQKF